MVCPLKVEIHNSWSWRCLAGWCTISTCQDPNIRPISPAWNFLFKTCPGPPGPLLWPSCDVLLGFSCWEEFHWTHVILSWRHQHRHYCFHSIPFLSWRSSRLQWLPEQYSGELFWHLTPAQPDLCSGDSGWDFPHYLWLLCLLQTSGGLPQDPRSPSDGDICGHCFDARSHQPGHLQKG